MHFVLNGYDSPEICRDLSDMAFREIDLALERNAERAVSADAMVVTIVYVLLFCAIESREGPHEPIELAEDKTDRRKRRCFHLVRGQRKPCPPPAAGKFVRNFIDRYPAKTISTLHSAMR